MINLHLLKKLLTLESFALGDADAVDHFILGEDILDRDLLLKMLTGKVNLVGNGATIELDLNDVGLLLSAPEKLLLSVADDSDDLTILLHLGKILLNLLLAKVILPLLAGLGECLLLRLRPVWEISLPNPKQAQL